MDELLSVQNLEEAFEHFSNKKDGHGLDGIMLSDLREYWELNHVNIEKELRSGSYRPGVVKSFEFVNGYGKRRTIVYLNTIDRFITRLLAQKMSSYIEPEFLADSYAYQNGKGVLDAVQKAKKYLESGYETIVEIDLKDYFDSISLKILLKKISEYITDYKVLNLIKKYLYCRIMYEDEIKEKTTGLLQGSPLSPVLSNLYLHDFDKLLDEKSYHWIRFADNIYVYTKKPDEAEMIFQELCALLKKYPWELKVNFSKSGIYPDAVKRKCLGYEFYEKNHRLEVKKCCRQEYKYFHNWHPSALQQVNHEYHIVQNGILNKKDFALLFENESHTYHIPTEATRQLNVYGNVTVTSGVLDLLSRNHIRMTFVDKYGNLMGHFVPNEYSQSALTTLKQCDIYNNPVSRLEMARYFEISGIHNMRANLRYYNKKSKNMSADIQEFSGLIKEINEAKDIDSLMLLEARAKQKYYGVFNSIILEEEFKFTKRTRRPPRDELNAMISFGNVVLYNTLLQIIWKTSLDPRIGIVHSTNRRSSSLNLDFADVFKPIIVDRVIFTLINCHQIKKEHFITDEQGAVYLSVPGKRIFVSAFDKKLQQKFVSKGNEYTYRQLLEKEIRDYQNYILKGIRYRPYKYY